MEIAFAGTGGSGKTTSSGTAAGVLAESAHSVVAVEGDANPNLGTTLGLPKEAFDEGTALTRDLLSRNGADRGGSVSTLARPLESIWEEHAVLAADGVRSLTLGRAAHAGSGCTCGNHAAVRAIMREIDDRETVVLDMGVSPEHPTRASAEQSITSSWWQRLTSRLSRRPAAITISPSMWASLG